MNIQSMQDATIGKESTCMNPHITADALERYYNVMQLHLGPHGARRLRYQMAFHYQNINFKGLKVLDVGGGNGIHSFHAAVHGAESVLNLEPEADGSTSGAVAQFRRLKSEIGVQNAWISASTFQKFNNHDVPFDMIIVHDAINHLDEESCVDLHKRKRCRKAYMKLFKKIASISRTGALLIFSDCSCRNLFPLIGLRNPFDPGIEWHKHQPPEIWVEMLKDVGFSLASQRWSTPSRLGQVGQTLLGNRFFTFFFTSHFVVTMRRI